MKNFNTLPKDMVRIPEVAMWKRFTGSMMATLALAACTDGERYDDAPVFQHPDKAAFLLNTEDNYYDQLGRVKTTVSDSAMLEKIERLERTPVAQWINGDIDSSLKVIDENLEQSKKMNAIPLFVAYNIPQRDLGSESSGGMKSEEYYKEWTRTVSERIGDSPAVIVLEPDALPDVVNMPVEAGDKRVEMLTYALRVYRDGNPNTAVYLDAGNKPWLESKKTAELLRRVDNGEGLVTAIALNVANHRSERESRIYAHDISNDFGRELHVIIDNAMNGAPNTDEIDGWCNVPDERVGETDTMYEPDLMVETAIIRTPGESGGRCGTSDKPAGEFDPNLLRRQVK